MNKLFAVVMAMIVAFLVVLARSTQASSTTPKPPVRFHNVPSITVPCGFTEVPYNVYSMPITQTETLTLHFQSSGNGMLLFSANNYQTFYNTPWTDANCGTCAFTLPNVEPGPINTMQLALDASPFFCPDAGITLSNFQLQISPVVTH